MLKTLYPVSFRRYSSLAILGPIADGFSTWLLEHRYTYTYRRQQVWLLSYVESVLNRRGVHNLNGIEHADLAACRKSLQRRFPYLTGANYALEKYLRIKTFLKPAEPKATNPAAILLAAYALYLKTVEGLQRLRSSRTHIRHRSSLRTLGSTSTLAG